MRILFNREKALRLSLLSFLKVPVLFLLILSLLLSGCGSKKEPVKFAASTSASSPAVTADTNIVSDSVSAGIIPHKIHIPTLGIEADVISLGLTKDGAMDVPKNDNDVAWFSPGYRPGTPGHAVLAGHVDSKTGPAVFYKLGKLSKGDKIILTDKDKKKLTFKVIATAKYPYDDAPLEEIFGPSDSELLNVITCTGAYSRSKGTHQERLVVTAQLIS